jgi:hypothetical protein
MDGFRRVAVPRAGFDTTVFAAGRARGRARVGILRYCREREVEAYSTGASGLICSFAVILAGSARPSTARLKEEVAVAVLSGIERPGDLRDGAATSPSSDEPAASGRA